MDEATADTGARALSGQVSIHQCTDGFAIRCSRHVHLDERIDRMRRGCKSIMDRKVSAKRVIEVLCWSEVTCICSYGYTRFQDRQMIG